MPWILSHRRLRALQPGMLRLSSNRSPRHHRYLAKVGGCFALTTSAVQSPIDAKLLLTESLRINSYFSSQEQSNRRDRCNMVPCPSHRTSLAESADALTLSTTTVVVTLTTVRWIEPSTTLKRIASPSQDTMMPPSASRVPGESIVSSEGPAQRSSQPGNEAASPTPPPTSLEPREKTAHEHHRPRASSSTLTLYDRHAEMPTPHVAALYDAIPHIPGSMQGGEFELPDIPPSFQLALFACLGAGALWSMIVWLINLSHLQSVNNAQKDQIKHNTTSKKQQGECRRKWWNRIWGHQQATGRIVTDKSQTYAALASGSSTGTTLSTETASTTATTIATPERTADTPIRLRRMTPAARRHAPPTPSLPPWQSPSPSTITMSATHVQPQRNSSRSRSSSSVITSSPTNPFLPYPVQPRSSSEYLAAHHAFFSKPLPTPPLPQPSPHLSPYPSRSASPLSDLDALEAQSDNTKDLPRSRSTRSVMHIADEVEKKGGMLWTGGWICLVEEGVNKAVDAVVRWTGDEGGEKGLLLPLGKARAQNE